MRSISNKVSLSLFTVAAGLILAGTLALTGCGGSSDAPTFGSGTETKQTTTPTSTPAPSTQAPSPEKPKEAPGTPPVTK